MRDASLPRHDHLDWIAAARRQAQEAGYVGLPSGDSPRWTGGSSGQVTDQTRAGGGSDQFGFGSLPGYEIAGENHRGGQGVVFRAIQRSTGRTVAIKVMREGPFAGEQDRIRFEREVAILAQLSHRNIVGILDRGVVAGSHFFVMDFVDGRPLDRYIRDESPLIADLLRLFCEICDTVHAAHLRGIIHRDLKPGNILIDAGGQPRILDFGLAKMTDSAMVGSAETATGQFIGSLPWASPEQACGRMAEVDIRSDVYSLGVMLYQILTGRLPYSTVGDIREVLDRIERQPPIRPRTLSHEIDDELETMVLTSLTKEPDRRYQSAGEFARDIRHYLAGEPIEAKRDSGWYVARKLVSRHRAAVGVAASFLLLLAGATAVSTSLWRQAIHDRDASVTARVQADSSRRRADSEAAKAKAVNEFLQEMLASANPAVAQDPNYSVKQALQSADKRLDAGSLDKQPEVQIAIRLTVGETYFNLGLYAESEDQLRKSLQLARQQHPGDHLDTAKILQALGETLDGKGAFEEAEGVLRESLAMFRRLCGDDHVGVGGCLNELAINQKTRGNLDAAESLYRESLEVARRVRGPESEQFATSLSNLSMIIAGKGQLEEAESMQRRVLAMRRKLLGDNHPNIAFSLSSLAGLVEAKGDSDQAESLHREALALRQRVLGPEHPDVATSMNNLGVLLDSRGRQDEAVALLRQALAMRRKLLGPDHMETAASLNNLAYTMSHKGDYAAAEPLFREGLVILKRAIGDRHPYVASGLWNLADALEGRGDYAGSEVVLMDMLQVRMNLHGEKHVKTAQAQARLALCRIHQEHYESAESLLRAALNTREALLDPGDWRIPHTRGLLGEALAGEHKHDSAELLLLASYAAMKGNSQTPADQVSAAVRRLARFYEGWDAAEPNTGKAEKAAEWRARLPAPPPTSAATSSPATAPATRSR